MVEMLSINANAPSAAPVFPAVPLQGSTPSDERQRLGADAAFLGILMLAFYAGNLYPMHILGVTVHAVALPFLVSGSLMISKTLRIPKP